MPFILGRGSVGVVKGWMVQFEFVRGQVGKTGVRPHRVEMVAPRLDDDLGFAAGAKPFDAMPVLTLST